MRLAILGAGSKKHLHLGPGTIRSITPPPCFSCTPSPGAFSRNLNVPTLNPSHFGFLPPSIYARSTIPLVPYRTVCNTICPTTRATMLSISVFPSLFPMFRRTRPECQHATSQLLIRHRRRCWDTHVLVRTTCHLLDQSTAGPGRDMLRTSNRRARHVFTRAGHGLFFL